MKRNIMTNKIIGIRQMLETILYNWQALLLFELIYKILGGIFVFPLLHEFINFTIVEAKIKYVNLDNVKPWILNTITIPILIASLLILGVYIMIEMSVMVQYFYSSKAKEKIGVVQLVKSAIKKAFHIVFPRNWILLLLVMVIFPITAFSITPDFLIDFHIPEYMVDFLKEQGRIYNVYLVILTIIEIIAFYLIYSIPIFILEDVSFSKACKKSCKMMKGKFLRTLFSYVIWMLSIVFLFFLICGIVLLFNIIKFRYIYYNEFSADRFLFSYINLRQYASFILNIVVFIASFAFIMNSYFRSNNEDIKVVETNKSKKASIGRVLYLSIIEGILIFIAIAIYIDYEGNAFSIYYFNNKNQEIVAHRAGSTFAPENTIVALEKAIKGGAAYAEIDVQQSKDKELIILHDTNFKRTTGVDKNVWDVDYDEIKTYDAGSYYSDEFEDVKIPTLEEMMEVAEGKIKLMIELKKNGHEVNLEEDVVDLIKKYNFKDNCVIASMDLEMLKKVKELDKDIKTVYISSIAYGEYYNIDYVDMFSIESTFVNKYVVNRIHDENKKVFVWTVNKDKSIRKMLSLHVDGVVTDNTDLAIYYRDLGSKDIFIEDLMESLFPEKSQEGIDLK